MGLLSDRQIKELVLATGMITPFEDVQIRTRHTDLGPERLISYGLSSYGYDIRIGDHFKVFYLMPSDEGILVDPKRFDERSFVEMDAGEKGYVTIPPNSFALGSSVEALSVPKDVLVLCIGKSTYARCGIIANVTPLEPEWRGHITMEITNSTPLPAKIYANEGIVQLVFLRGDEPCQISYADKRGKYQDQAGVTLPRV